MKLKRQHHNLMREWGDIRICTNIQNGKVDSVWSSMPPKIRIGSKKALNKSSLKLNFVQKTPEAHMSVFPRSGARGFERFPSLQNYYEQKRGSRFSLGLDAAKNTHCIKKKINKSCSKLNFVQKSPRVHMSTSPPVELGGSKDSHLWKLYIIFQRWESFDPPVSTGKGRRKGRTYAVQDFFVRQFRTTFI